MSPKVRSILISLAFTLAGFGLAVLIFVVFMNYSTNREKESLIPNAKEALSAKEYSKSISLFLKAEKEYPNNTEVKRSLAELYYLKGKFDDSQKYFELIKKNEQTKSDYQKLGDIYLRKNNNDKVIELWNGKELDPVNTYNLAKIYYDKEDFENYFAELTKIQRYKEPFVLLQIKEKNLNNIVTNLDKAVSMNVIFSTEQVNINLFKSQMQEAKKQADLGKKDYSDLIQISAFSNINQCRLLTDRLSNLRKSLEAKRIVTYQIDYYQGNCFNQVNKPDEAIPLIENAIKSDSTVPEYRETLAKSYFLKKDAEKIKQIYTDLLIIQKSSTYYQNLAVYLYKLDKKDEALENYDLALANAKAPEDKKKISLTILQINFRDKQNLEICKRPELLEQVKNDSNEEILIKGHCSIYLGNGFNETGLNSGSLVVRYLRDINEGNKKDLDVVLDKDPDGLITTYYSAVGTRLLKS